jgi:hypothetical protein
MDESTANRYRKAAGFYNDSEDALKLIVRYSKRLGDGVSFLEQQSKNYARRNNEKASLEILKCELEAIADGEDGPKTGCSQIRVERYDTGHRANRKHRLDELDWMLK